MRQLFSFFILLGVSVGTFLSAAPCLGQVRSGLGESCEATSDCVNGLVCSGLKCVGTIDSVKSCKKTADCSNGFRCIDQKCIPRQVFGAWIDPISGLTWQNPPAQSTYNWKDAQAYCSKLELGGYSDWRLPTISELRSLIRGCPANQTGGSCRVTDSCRSYKLCDENCPSCSYKEGRCYWPSEMQGKCSWYWSSSPVEDLDDGAWDVSFNRGHVDNIDVLYGSHVRCVR